MILKLYNILHKGRQRQQQHHQQQQQPEPAHTIEARQPRNPGRERILTGMEQKSISTISTFIYLNVINF